jgi:hypothetical protein
MGLLGGIHCAGMCGGIISALTLGITRDKREHSNTLTLYLLFYNFGRIVSYIIAGIAMAALGIAIKNIGDAMVIREIFSLIAAGVMILLGLYLTGWWPKAILKIEHAGSFVWKIIEPLARKLLPVKSTGQALMAGLLWGWLPCGLVYTALLLALSAESIVQGGLIMASFGIGTLPALFGIGFFSASLMPHLQKKWLRTTAGLTVLSFGLYQLLTLYV